jgi:hypothetical protein
MFDIKNNKLFFDDTKEEVKNGTEAYTNDYANQSLPMKCKEDEIEIKRLQKNIAKLKEQLANLKQD